METPELSGIKINEDGYLLHKSYHKSKIIRVIDWKEMNITDKEIRDYSSKSMDKNFKGPNHDDEAAMDRFHVIILSLPYNPPPDERDVFVYYNDIGVLCGRAGYMRIRDGYVYGEKVVMMS